MKENTLIWTAQIKENGVFGVKRTLIVDAYNYIFSGNKNIGDFQSARDNFIDYMVDFNAKSNDYDDVILVFDGNQKQIIKKLGLTIVFTEKRKTADQTIEKLIATTESTKNVTLVTNDNVSRNLATGFGAKTFSTGWLESKFKFDHDEATDSQPVVTKNTIEDNIDPAVRNQLNKMIGRFAGNDET